MSRRRGLDLLAIHGIVLRSADVESLAKRLRGLLGLPVFRRTRREIVLGHGAELFNALRRATRSRGEGIEELHIAVKEIAPARRTACEDPLGGDSWTRPLGNGLSLTVRQFRRPPRKAWRKPRPPV
jgi:hypothetical protein